MDERIGVVREPVDALADVPRAGLVDPPTEVRRGSDIRAHGDRARRRVWRGSREIEEEAPEALLRRSRAAVRMSELRGNRGWPSRLGSSSLQPIGRLTAQTPLVRSLCELRPWILVIGSELDRKLLPLVARQERGVIARMALGRQTPCLDRVGEDDRRPVAGGVCIAIGVEYQLEVVPAEITDRERELSVVE